MINTKFKKALPGIGIVALLLAFASVLWRDSEQQYVAMTNLGLRLRVLQQSVLDGGRFGQKNRPSWKIVWKPMVTAMQFEANHAAMRWQGVHLSRPMYEQLSRFAGEKIDDESDLMGLLSNLNFSDDVVAAQVPLIFSEQEQQYSRSAVAGFRGEISAILSSEAAYSEWLSPILYQQQVLDKSTTCKTLMEIRAFQTYADRLKNKCASETKKWSVCGGDDEPIARQMQELQISAEANLKKFKTRWSVENVSELCSDL